MLRNVCYKTRRQQRTEEQRSRSIIRTQFKTFYQSSLFIDLHISYEAFEDTASSALNIRIYIVAIHVNIVDGVGYLFQNFQLLSVSFLQML